MLPMPSAIDKAKQLIKDNPNLFKNDVLTQIALSQAMIEYNFDCCLFQFESYSKRDVEKARQENKIAVDNLLELIENNKP